MARKIIKTDSRKTVKVAKMPLVELVCRLSDVYDEDSVRRVINSAISKDYQSGDGLIITYDKNENIFVVVSTNDEYDNLSELYLPDFGDDIINRILNRNPKRYRFAGGESFTKEEVELIKECKSKDTPEAQLITKMINEMMTRNMYNYAI